MSIALSVRIKIGCPSLWISVLQMEGMTTTTTSDHTFLLQAKQFSYPQSISHLSRFSIS
jgi:hypothetical protein